MHKQHVEKICTFIWRVHIKFLSHLTNSFSPETDLECKKWGFFYKLYAECAKTCFVSMGGSNKALNAKVSLKTKLHHSFVFP